MLRERLTDDEKNTSPLIRNSSIQAHSNGITSTIDEMREVYQTDSCVRQRRIEGCRSEIVEIWVVGYAERTLTTSSRVEQVGLLIFLISGDCLNEVTRVKRTLREAKFDNSLWLTKVNAGLRLERAHLVVLEDC